MRQLTYLNTAFTEKIKNCEVLARRLLLDRSEQEVKNKKI
jgi:hypothetical protein